MGDTCINIGRTGRIWVRHIFCRAVYFSRAFAHLLILDTRLASRNCVCLVFGNVGPRSRGGAIQHQTLVSPPTRKDRPWWTAACEKLGPISER